MRTNFQSEKEEADKLYKMAKEEVDREQSALLKKMIEKQEHDIKLTKVIAFAECSLLVVLIVVFLVLIPRFFTTVQKVESTMEDVNHLIETSEKSLKNIQDLVADADEIMMTNE
jgi:predicted PurR-regulated permease PerM